MTALSLILPCFNEAERLPDTFARYLGWFPADRAEVEFVVVDDGSTDGTFAVAELIVARDRRVRLLRTMPNHGKGYAVRTGMLAAKGDRVVFTDADGSYAPEEVERVLRALDRAPVAIGVRPAAGPREASGRAEAGAAVKAGPGPALRRLASRVFNLAMRRVLGMPFRDTQCGLKGFHRDAAVALFSRGRLDGFAFDAEILFLAMRLGYEVVEVPVRAAERDGSKVRLAVDALRMLREVWSVRRAAARGAYDQPADHTRLRNQAG